jgi:hypothetical protein
MAWANATFKYVARARSAKNRLACHAGLDPASSSGLADPVLGSHPHLPPGQLRRGQIGRSRLDELVVVVYLGMRSKHLQTQVVRLPEEKDLCQMSQRLKCGFR